MKRLTPAGLTLTMLVVVGLLVTAYFAKLVLAEGTSPRQSLAGATTEPDGRLQATAERPALDISMGMRGVSLSLSADSALSSLLRPGDSVDVLSTPTVANSDDGRLRGGLTVTLFRGVRLLALQRPRSGQSDKSAPNSAILELTPEQANVLVLARSKGEIALTYNPDGSGDGGVAATSPDRATLDQILGLAPPVAPLPPVVPRPFISESYRGKVRSTHEFPAGDATAHSATRAREPRTI